MSLDELACDRQSETRPTGPAAARSFETIEGLEHCLALGIGDAVFILRRRSAWPIADAVTGYKDLPKNLRGRQVSHKALRASMAEGASERAADLARYA